jgi:hypothetical protein
MSFLQKARDAATQAAEQARQTALNLSDAEKRAIATQRAKVAAGRARRGLTTVVEKIDPATLADLIIKATALQEKTNAALRAKRSPYRISEVVISASIPPGVNFSIGRVISDPADDEVVLARSSTDLLSSATEPTAEAVLALDGTTADMEAIAAITSTDDEAGSE